jgi:hypothetical protein
MDSTVINWSTQSIVKVHLHESYPSRKITTATDDTMSTSMYADNVAREAPVVSFCEPTLKPITVLLMRNKNWIYSTFIIQVLGIYSLLLLSSSKIDRPQG